MSSKEQSSNYARMMSRTAILMALCRSPHMYGWTILCSPCKPTHPNCAFLNETIPSNSRQVIHLMVFYGFQHQACAGAFRQSAEWSVSARLGRRYGERWLLFGQFLDCFPLRVLLVLNPTVMRLLKSRSAFVDVRTPWFQSPCSWGYFSILFNCFFATPNSSRLAPAGVNYVQGTLAHIRRVGTVVPVHFNKK